MGAALPGGYSSDGETPLCHPDAGTGRPDCYRLVTVYGHVMSCSPCKITRSWSLIGLPLPNRSQPPPAPPF